jgi:hypothetical protein
MSTGKHTSLDEALKKKQIDRFAKEHPSKGDKKQFTDLLDRMTRNLPVTDQTSKKG